VALICPFPSNGLPKGSITRPKNSFPTGIDKICPVHLAVSPSLTKEESPNKMTPTESLAKSKTVPKTSFGKAIHSPCIALSNP